MSPFKTRKIHSASTVGARLKSARKKKKLTLETAEESTKVRAKYLQAIENDDWREFPSRIYVLGFVRRYAEFLELDSDKILQEFKTEFGRAWSDLKGKSSAKKFAEDFIITPKLIISTTVIIAVLAMIFYVALSINKFSRPPEIAIIAPKEEVVTDKTTLIEGKTSDTAVVEINSQTVNVSDSGEFTQKVDLTEGLNIFEISAKNRIGKEFRKTLKVIYQPK